MILQLVLHNNHNIFMALQSSCGCNILHEVVERRSPSCSSTCNAGAMTMFNITDGKNNISRDKPVEHIDLVIGLHVSACTSCTRTMRVRRDIAIDITESVQLLVRFNALRSMPVMPKLEHYNQNAAGLGPALLGLAGYTLGASALARPPHSMTTTTPQTLLGRLLRVVLPVKRDCSPDNPKTPGDYSSCAHEE